MDSEELKNQTYKLAYLALKREFEESNKKFNDTVVSLVMEKTELAQSNQRYHEIVENLADELAKLTGQVKALEQAGEENIQLHEKIHHLESELCTVTLEYNNTITKNQQLKQSLKNLQSKVIRYNW